MATNQLPFSVEYARSGRSLCKMCKKPIDKDELRIAVMVQSRFHDGKDPHWHHTRCLFSKAHPKTVGDIFHFEELRWEDQQMLKEKCDGSEAGKKGKTKNGTTDSTTLSDFKVEYAKSAVSKCGDCEEKIPKGAIRISKKDFLSEKAVLYGAADKWHHLDCFIKTREDLQFLLSGDKLPGYQDMDVEDKAILKKKLPAIGTTTKRKLVSQPQAKPAKQSKSAAIEPEVSKLQKPNQAELDIASQSKQLFKNRDRLSCLKKSDVEEIMRYNKQDVVLGITGPGPDAIILRLADNMTFGKLKPCPKCKGQYVFKSGVGYECEGFISEYAKCLDTTDSPARVKFSVPQWANEESAFEGNFSLYPQKRLIPQHVASSVGANISNKGGGAKKLLQNLEIVVMREDTAEVDNFEKVKKRLKLLGANVTEYASNSTAVIVCLDDTLVKSDLRKASKKMGIPIVSSEKFLKDMTSTSLVDCIMSSNMSSWIKVDELKERLRSLNREIETKAEARTSKGDALKIKETVKKYTMKGGAIVDPASGLEHVGHVYKESGVYWNAILNRIDVDSGSNSYYKLQIIESDKNRKYWLFRSWGRIGTTIGGDKTEPTDDVSSAKEGFSAIYEERTHNKFGVPFRKVRGGYVPMNIDYGEAKEFSKLVVGDVQSTLPIAIQELVSLIFDVDKMKETMLQFEIDLDKMPLGKISNQQIKDAFKVLTKAQRLLELTEAPNAREIVDASNRFFTYIPHNFGISLPPLLNNLELIKTKIEMLESLMEIELAFELLRQSDDKQGSPLDSHYHSLKADMEVLGRKSKEHKIIEMYLANTHAETHDEYDIDVTAIFKVNRNGESERYQKFKDLHNRKLLWHGSRTTNYAGILSQGLRIAPPEAPSTGYMFGKGIYFADMVSKSANYCYPSDNDPGLLLLCEVALGDMHEMTSARETMNKAPKGHSVKGVGKTHPDPVDKYVFPDGMEVPYGKPVPSDVAKTPLLYNEYIVYDVAQVNIRYMVRVNFKRRSSKRRS